MSPEPGAAGSSRFKTVILNSLANLVFPLTTLITGPLLARALGPEGRGVVAALLAPLALANLMFTLGVPDALTYFVARGSLTRGKAFQIAIGGGLICAAAACSVLFIAAPYLFRTQTQLLPPFKLLLLTLPVTLGFSAIRGIALGRQRFVLINREQIFGALLRLSLLVGLLGVHAVSTNSPDRGIPSSRAGSASDQDLPIRAARVGKRSADLSTSDGLTQLFPRNGQPLTPLLAVWVSVLSGAFGSVFLLPALRRNGRAKATSADTGTVARYAGSAALGTFGGLLVIRLDQVLMVSLTTHAQLAYYSVAASLAELPLVVVSAIRDVAFSVTAERDDPKIIARACRLTVLTIAILCLCSALATPVVLPVLFSKQFAPAVPMVELLLAGTLARAVTAVIGAGLMTIGKTWLRSAIQLGGAALTAILLFIMVPRWGGMGAAWVTAITYGALAFASMFVYGKATSLRFRECLIPTAIDVQDLSSAIKANLH